jgi:DNA-binding SARP family transcriptional activator
MRHLKLTLLGAPQVWVDGRPAKFVTRKSLALLCYLVTEAVPVSRASLIALLWPDSDNKRGRTALRTALTHLRDAVGDSDTDSAQPLVLADGDALRLNPHTVLSLDTHAVATALCATVPSVRHTQHMSDARVWLESAVASYRGDFLSGFSLSDAPAFDDWASLQREHWHLQLSRVDDLLSRLLLDGGEFARGIDIAQGWVQHDPLNESAHRRLMQLCMATGDRTGALHAYANCQAVLGRELNADPSEETQALMMQARAQAALPEQDDVRPSRTSVLQTLPLIGRAAEHNRLIDAYRAARGGEPQAIILVGEPGIGKTRLAREFCGWATSRGTRILRGSAFNLRFNPPYQIWINALRQQLLHVESRQAVRSLQPTWQTQLVRLMPELTDLVTEVESAGQSLGVNDVGDVDARLNLYEAVYHFINALLRLENQALVIHFDDLQWADAASLDLLHYIGHRWTETQSPILVIATVRTDDAPMLREQLDALKHRLKVTTIELGALTPEDTTRLVQSLIERTDAQHPVIPPNQPLGMHAFATQLFKDTSGHPLYLVETLRSLLERHAHPDLTAISGDDLARWQTTLEGWTAPGVVELIQSRLGRLPQHGQALLNALAVVGQEAQFETCCATSGLAEDEALAMLDEVKARGIVRESFNGSVSFTHDKIREVVYRALGSARRHSLHRQTGEVLIRQRGQHPDDMALRIAHHFDAAEDDRALDYFQLAGEAALRVHAHAEAARHFDRAVAWLHQQPLAGTLTADTKAKIIRLYFAKAGVHTQMADYRASAQACKALEAWAREWGDDALALSMMIWRAGQLAVTLTQPDLAEAERLATEALPLAQAAGRRGDEVTALLALTRVAGWRCDFASMRRYGLAALDVLKRSPDPQSEAYALNDLAMYSLFANDFGTAERYQRRALGLWRGLDKPATLVNNLCIAMLVAIRTGRYADASSLFEEAQAISRRMDSEWAHLNSTTHIGAVYLEQGQHARAMAALEEAVAGTRRLSLPVLFILSRVDLANAYGGLGQAEHALPLLAEAIQVAGDALPMWRLLVIAARVRAAVQLGDLSGARAYARDGHTALTLGPTLPLARIAFDMALAELYLAGGQLADAIEHSQAAVDACRLDGLRQYLPQALLLNSQGLRAHGATGEARDVLNQARAEAEAIGAQWSLQQVLAAMTAMDAGS